MPDSTNSPKNPNIHANHNSNAVGSISAGGDISGNIHVGNIGFSTEEVTILITQIQSSFQTKPFDGRCPYKGLDVFEEEDAELFFGREKLVDDLVSRVMDSRTVFVTGPSGSGKSSLVRAGLIHVLKQGKIKGGDRWLYATMKPGRDPIGELGRVISSLASSTNPEDEIRAKAMKDAAIFARWCEIVLKEGRDKRLVLFIDQFEEVFTQISNEEERVAFLNLLTHAATIENGRGIILFSMRSDFVSNCATYPQLNALLNQQFVQIGAMQPEELVSAIAQPALRVGLRIDPDLIAQIINEMKGEPGALPLMQFALKDLFDSQHEKSGVPALILNDYLQRGGIHKALERHADDSFSKLSKNEQELARSIFSGLIEIGRGTQDTKRTALFDELVPANTKAEDVEAIVQKLADARLITTDEAAGKDTVTISHEKLIDAWPWLKKLVNENRDVIALQNEIASDAKEWVEHKRDASYLYSGARLVTAQEKIKDLALSGSAQLFLNTSFEAEEDAKQKSRRLQRGILTGSLAFSAVVLLLFIFALTQLNTARAQQLGAQAQVALVKKDFNTALLYAYQSNLVSKNDAANLVLSQLVYENFSGGEYFISPFRNFNGVPININTLAWSPDGILATGSDDGKINLWDIRKSSYNPVKTLMGHKDRVTMVAWSQDGQLASSSWDGTVIVWNIKTGQPSKILRGHNYTVSSVAWSANEQLASGAQDSTVIIWDTNTGLPAQKLKGHTNTVTGVAWSATGQLASASADKTIIIWNLQTREPAQILKGHTDTVRRVAWSTDGKLASDSMDGTIIIWDIKNNKPLQTIPAFPDDIAWSAEGNLTFVSNEGMMIIWDPIKGLPVQILSEQRYNGKLAWSLDERLAATINGGIILIQYPDNLLAQTLELTGEPNSNPVWSADGMLASSFGSSVTIWDLATGQPSQILKGQDIYVDNLAWSADGQLASSNFSTSIVIWDLKTGKPAQTLKNTEWVTSMAWSADGQLASGADNGTILIWDLKTGQPAQTLKGHTGRVNSVAWSTDGKLASGSLDGKVIIWDLKTGSPAKILDYGFGSIESISWFANDRLAAGLQNFSFTDDSSTIIIWDVKTGNPSRILEQVGAITSIAWSANGVLASGSVTKDGKENTLIIWDLKTGQPFLTIRGVSNAAWSPNGQLAWNSPDGIRITNPYIATDLCYMMSRNMTIEEWLQYEGVLYIYQPACSNLYNPAILSLSDMITNLGYINDLGEFGVEYLPNLLITWPGRGFILVFLAIVAASLFWLFRHIQNGSVWWGSGVIGVGMLAIIISSTFDGWFSALLILYGYLLFLNGFTGLLVRSISRHAHWAKILLLAGFTLGLVLLMFFAVLVLQYQITQPKISGAEIENFGYFAVSILGLSTLALVLWLLFLGGRWVFRKVRKVPAV